MRTIKSVVMCLFLGLGMANTVFAQSFYGNYGSYNNYDAQAMQINNAFNDVVGKQIGPVDLKAKVSSEEQYDSNIFWTPNNKKGDVINITSPAVLLEVPLGLDQRHLLQFMYQADIDTFSQYTSQNAINQYATFNGDFKLPFGYVNLSDGFDHTSDRAFTEFTGRVVHTDNDASAAVGVKFNKLTMETGYTDDIRTYDSDLYAQYGYTEDMISETAFYQIFPKTKALVEYDHGWITYYKDAGRDGSFDQERIGLKGYITAKTQGIVKLGFQDRTYDNYSGFSGFVAEVGTITQLSERTRLSLTYDQGAQESTYLNNNYYDMHYFYATLDQKLMHRWSLQLTSGISRNIYPEIDPTLFQKRQDSILVEGIALKYTFNQWAFAKLGYTFREDMSSIYSQSYNDNLLYVGFELQY